MDDGLYDIEFVGAVDGKPRVRLTKVVPDVPEPQPPAKPGEMRRITSDDGSMEAWLIAEPGAYSLDRDIETKATAIFVVAKGPVTIDMRGRSIRFGTAGINGCCGINTWRSFSKHGTYGSDDAMFRSALSPYVDWSDKNRWLYVADGAINYVGDRAAQCIAAIGGDYVFESVSIHSMRLFSAGDDSLSVVGRDVEIVDSTSVLSSTKTKDRESLPCNIRATRACAAYNNDIIGGNNGFVVTGHSEIVGNFIAHGPSFATNGYGVHLYRTQGCVVEGNVIVPVYGGRGIMIGGSPNGVNDPAQTVVRNNLIAVIEEPNAEYGYKLVATGIRSRYDVKNLLVENNRVLAIGGCSETKRYTGAAALYLTHRDGSRNVQIINNRFSAVHMGDHDLVKQELFAVPVGFFGEGSYLNGPGDTVRQTVLTGNELESNCFMLGLSWRDGGCNLEGVHFKSAKWRSGGSIIGDFINELAFNQVGSASGEPYKYARVAEQLTRYMYEPGPSNPRAMYMLGMGAGSRIQYRLDSLVDENPEAGAAEQFRFYTTRHPYEITCNDDPPLVSA